MSDTKEMSAYEREQAYWAANNDEAKAMEYQVANGTIDEANAVTDVVNKPKKTATVQEKAKGEE